MKNLTKRLEILTKYLAGGWSISYSLSKAGIDQREHTVLLKDPKYKAIIDMHRQTPKSPTEIYNLRMREAKKSMI